MSFSRFHDKGTIVSRHNPIANKWSSTMEHRLWKECNLHLDKYSKIDWDVMQRMIPNKTINAIKSKWRDLKRAGGPASKIEERNNPKTKTIHFWTWEQKKYIKKHKEQYSWLELTKKIEELWGVSVSVSATKIAYWRAKQG